MRSWGEQGAHPQGRQEQQRVAGQLFCTCGFAFYQHLPGEGTGGPQLNPVFALGSRLAPGAAVALCSLPAPLPRSRERRQRLGWAPGPPCRGETGRQPLSQAPSREPTPARSDDLPLTLQQHPGNPVPSVPQRSTGLSGLNSEEPPFPGNSKSSFCSTAAVWQTRPSLPGPKPPVVPTPLALYGEWAIRRGRGDTMFPGGMAPSSPQPSGEAKGRAARSSLRAQRPGRVPNAAGRLHMVGFAGSG